MIQEIRTIDDVKTFFNELHAEGLSFHPDDVFEDYIHIDTKQPFYTEEETKQRNTLLTQAFDICESKDADIYDLCIDIFMADFHSL